MKKSVLLAALCAASVVLAITGAAPAYAKVRRHHPVVCHKHNYHCRVSKSQISSMVRTAQASLANLGYYNSRADGIMGPLTRKAVKAFQIDHGFNATGILTNPTYDAIVQADSHRAMGALPVQLTPPPALAAQLPREELGLIPSTNQTYADPLIGGDVVAGGRDQAQSAQTKPLGSRFAKLDINENNNGPIRRYSITVNGSPLLQVDNQPSVIGVSETYQLADEDAIILSTYNDGDSVCPYKHYLLTLAQGRNELRTFGNCTQGYQARLKDGSLFVTFPEFDDQRVAGATWRYDAGDLEKL